MNSKNEFLNYAKLTPVRSSIQSEALLKAVKRVDEANAEIKRPVTSKRINNATPELLVATSTPNLAKIVSKVSSIKKPKQRRFQSSKPVRSQ